MLPQLLVALACVIALGQLLGRLFRRIGQPPVIGEVVAGILLGPSLLGWVAPAAYAFVLPPEVAPLLGAVAQLGVILYMFLVGLELNPERLRGRVGTTVAISHAGILVPFVMGAALAFYLAPRFSASGVPFTSFALFVGIAMSITAFPVLARILSDRGLTQTDLGSLALTAAAIADVTAWCLLAVVVGVVQPDGPSAIVVAALTAGFVAVMIVLVRPLAVRLAVRSAAREPDGGTVAVVLVALLAAALATEAIGVHAIFGAFLLGAVMPHEGRLAVALHTRFEHLVTILLLPAFFAFTGMRTEIGLLTSWTDWAACGLIILVATVGKVGGTYTAARFAGVDGREATALGVLMNTRGLMEIIVLNVGLELGVISPTLFTMFVVMALVTTVATGPMLAALAGSRGSKGSRGSRGSRGSTGARGATGPR